MPEARAESDLDERVTRGRRPTGGARALQNRLLPEEARGKPKGKEVELKRGIKGTVGGTDMDTGK